MAEAQGQNTKMAMKGRLAGLSGRVLAVVIAISLLVQLTVLGVLVTNRWTDSLSERLAAALVAVLVQDAATDMQVSNELRNDLLRVSGVDSIALKTEDYRQLVLTSGDMHPIDARIDLRTASLFKRLYYICETVLRGGDGHIQVVGDLQKMPGEFIEILMSETELYDQLLDVLVGGLIAAFALAAFVGLTLFFLLSRLLVRPVRQITHSMVNFASDPENPSNTLTAWNRYDEIGTAARNLRDLQIRLRNLLGEKRRLADLGSAVARINHDLRNLFATMQLVSDTLERVDDVRVQRAAPRLVRALERGIAMCQATLDYGRAGTVEAAPKRQPLRSVIEEALDQFSGQDHPLGVDINIPSGQEAVFDADHLFRIISNLSRNALAAMDPERASLSVSSKADGDQVVVTFCDTGPGIPESMHEALFTAFSQSTSKGGSGLGLAISRELARSMDGDVVLAKTDTSGTCFNIVLPR